MGRELNIRQALVTGASRGIGQAIARQLAKQGMEVYGTAVTKRGVEAIQQTFQQDNISGEAFTLDISNTKSITALFDKLKARNIKPLVLINNAGIALDNLLIRLSDEDWERVIRTNLTSVFHLCKACAHDMIKVRWGRIINITSVSGLMGNAGQCNYAAAKAGMIGFAKSLARELAPRNITVNCIAPGFIDTDMTQTLPENLRDELKLRIPLKRFGTADEVAAVAALLASPEGAYITGETIAVSGGLYMY